MLHPFPWYPWLRSGPSSHARARTPMLALAATGLLAVLAQGAAAQTIDNGLAPPEPANVFDEPDTGSPYIRNQGCRTEPLDTPCLGTPSTTVRLVEPGDVDYVRVYDSSVFEIEGGLVTWTVELHHQAHLEMTGGVVSDPYLGLTALDLRDSSTAHLAGGTLHQILFLQDQAQVTMDGGELLEVLGTGLDSRFEMWGGRVGREGPGWIPDGLNTDGQLLFHGDASAQRLRAGSLQMWGGAVDDWVAARTGSITGGTVGGQVMTSAGGDLLVAGGTLHGGAAARTGASLAIEGGAVAGGIVAATDGVVQLRGGSIVPARIGHVLRPFDGSIEVVGTDFAVDGVPAPYGTVAALEGLLTGRLRGGELVTLTFEQQDPPGLVLVPGDPLLEVHEAGPVSVTEPAGSLVGRGTAALSVTGTSVGYLELEDEASALAQDAVLEGHLVATDGAHVDLADSPVAASVLLDGAAELSMAGGWIGLGLVAAGSSLAQVVDARVDRDVRLRDTAQVTLTRTDAPGLNGAIHLGDGAQLVLDSSAVDNIYADGTSEVSVLGDASVDRLDLNGSASVSLQGGLVDWLSAETTGEVLLDGGHVVDLVTYGFGGSWSSSDPWVRLRILDGRVEEPLYAHRTAVVEIAGGQLDGDVTATDLSSVEIRGGTLGGVLRASESGVVEVQGSGFAVDGVPAPDGPIAAASGRLTGTLASGDPLDVPFEHAGANGAWGTITLLPEPGAAWLQLAGVLGVAALSRRRGR